MPDYCPNGHPLFECDCCPVCGGSIYYCGGGEGHEEQEKKESIERLSQAHRFAAFAHMNQVRKTPMVPGAPHVRYSFHPSWVADEVGALGAPDDVIVAACLHDVVEDTGKSIEEIRTTFGYKVADLVLECTEIGLKNGKEKAPWEERKEAYLEHLSTVSDGALLISVADKLQSLRELYRQVRHRRDAAYEDLVHGTIAERKRKTLWFHRQLAKQFRLQADARGFADEQDWRFGILLVIEDFEKIVEDLCSL